MTKRPNINRPAAARAIKGLKGRVLIADIIHVVCDGLGLMPSQIKGSSQKAEYAGPRHIAMWLAHQLTGLSSQKIGKEFGGRHHTTVLYAVCVIDRLRVSDPETREVTDGLLAKLKGVQSR